MIALFFKLEPFKCIKWNKHLSIMCHFSDWRLHAYIKQTRIIYIYLWQSVSRLCDHQTKYIYTSSSSCRATSTDIPDPLSPHLPVDHRLWQVLRAISRILTELRAGRPALARPCAGVHRRISLMSSSLLLQQCPAYLVRLTLIVFVMGRRWPYSCCFVGCCLKFLFKISCSILV